MLLYHNGKPIDVNQRVIAAELLSQECFNSIFIGLRVFNQRFRVKLQDRDNSWIDIDRVQEPVLIEVI